MALSCQFGIDGGKWGGLAGSGRCRSTEVAVEGYAAKSTFVDSSKSRLTPPSTTWHRPVRAGGLRGTRRCLQPRLQSNGTSPLPPAVHLGLGLASESPMS